MSTSSAEEFAYDANPILLQTSWTATSQGEQSNQGTKKAGTESNAILGDSGQNSEAPWTWTPMWRRDCTFGPEAFDAVMQNLVRNPNNLSSWLFRADIVYAAAGKAAQDEPKENPKTDQADSAVDPAAALPNFSGLARNEEETIVRRLIPRNTMRDDPMLQTCLFYKGEEEHENEDGHAKERKGPGVNHGVEHDGDHENGKEAALTSLVVYLPHVATAAAVPFYHPKVRGVGFLHEWRPISGTGTVSTHFSFFPPTVPEAGVDPDPHKKSSRPVLARVGLSLLQTVHKHGEGKRSGYVKRVHHDQLVPQARVQDRYMRLKAAHARRLVRSWEETTDPDKHVFEDLSIAAFLIELWEDMYGEGGRDKKSNDSGKNGKTEENKVAANFPGFVDIGCGNGLLVHILNEEGYRGWGFDARKRRSWEQYGNGSSEDAQGQDQADNSNSNQQPLQKRLLLPFFLVDGENDTNKSVLGDQITHDGRFPPGTFIIANHADELTVWAPLLAALAGCPFIAIPCCSHNFTGSRFRAPPPSAAKRNDPTLPMAASSSTYGSFVEWVVDVAEACGWAVEREMLRIPSTRNVGLVGRRRRRRQRPDDGDAEDAIGDGKDKATASKMADTPPHLSIDGAWAIINQFGGAGGFAASVAKLATQEHKSGH